MSSPQWKVLFTCGWAITEADEAAIMAIPASAWKPGIAQDGTVEQDKDVAEVTGLMTRAEGWPGGLRWIARRVKPSRRHKKNLRSEPVHTRAHRDQHAPPPAGETGMRSKNRSQHNQQPGFRTPERLRLAV